MKKISIIFGLLLTICLQASWRDDIKIISVHEGVRTWILNELRETSSEISKSIKCTDSLNQLKSHYETARMHYKRIEFFIEYCSPREAKYFINGPLVYKQDHETNEAIAPCGFQRLEELLFNKSNKCDTVELHKQDELLLVQLSNLTSYYKNIEIADGKILEMCQLQLFRIAAMNLNGYDATISQTNVKESFWCMEGIEKVLKSFMPYCEENSKLKKLFKNLLEQISEIKKYLSVHPSYETFDRLGFIVRYINPLNKSIVSFHNASGVSWDERPQALNLHDGFLFGKESFNQQYFSMYYNDTINNKSQAQLGKLLFFDPILSGNNKRACASCHNPLKAFSDGQSKSPSFDETGMILRNTPGLLNVFYQKAFFYDGRAYQLEQQVFDVVHNKKEMQSNLDDVVNKLKKSLEYRNLFASAFSGSADTTITTYSIKKAITEYEKTLVSMDSRFDQYLHGDFKMLNKREINGYNLFAGKALCGSCHFLPLFNGTVPPFYNDSEFEVIGTPNDSGNKTLDPDMGRYAISNIPEQKNAFKTPSLRNIELTGPYMHNGIYTSLEQVVEFYHRGGGAGLKISVPNQTLPFDSLNLTDIEKVDIVLFLKTLTDSAGTTSKPLRLPAFNNDSLLNGRKPGGEY